MSFAYNLRAVGVKPHNFPYVSLGDCMGLDCEHPGVQVEFLRWCLQSFNATMTVNPTLMNDDDVVSMLGNGSADISLYALSHQESRLDKVAKLWVV
ncbi:unnamed protein product [Cylicostephanus goldi]|uniref:Uncharacterized protein n=1 Tax=Cylicostephanus goldi TaxID=71465 RepID=A0A3P6R9K0_CYLGO|nr:unnamed protein product [Cylicostephanus goldi]